MIQEYASIWLQIIKSRNSALGEKIMRCISSFSGREARPNTSFPDGIPHWFIIIQLSSKILCHWDIGEVSDPFTVRPSSDSYQNLGGKGILVLCNLLDSWLRPEIHFTLRWRDLVGVVEITTGVIYSNGNQAFTVFTTHQTEEKNITGLLHLFLFRITAFSCNCFKLYGPSRMEANSLDLKVLYSVRFCLKY